MEKSEKIALIVFIIFFSVNAISLPKSPGSFYEPSHFYNLFLPNFGVGSDVSILPNASNSLATQYSLNKVMLEFTQNDILYLYRHTL